MEAATQKAGPGDFYCSLCSSQKLVEVDTVDVGRLKEFYSSHFNLDVSRFYPEDALHTYLCTACGLRMHAPAMPGDSEFYDHMQGLEFYYEKDKPEFNYAIETLIRLDPASILEVGSGEGNFLAKVMHAYTVKAAELSEKSIKKLKEKGIELDQPDDRYEFCASFQVLEHVPDVKQFLEFMVSKLNPGGHLLISVPNKGSKYHLEQHSPVLDCPPHHMTQWTRTALESVARLFELEIVDYYEEPHRVEHYQALIKFRRDLLVPRAGVKAKLTRAIALLLDPVLAPYMLDLVRYPGMTHAMLFRKPG